MMEETVVSSLPVDPESSSPVGMMVTEESPEGDFGNGAWGSPDSSTPIQTQRFSISAHPEIEDRMEVVAETNDSVILDLSSEENIVCAEEEGSVAEPEDQTEDQCDDPAEVTDNADQAMEAQTDDKEEEGLHSVSVDHEEDQALASDSHSVSGDKNEDQGLDKDSASVEQSEDCVSDNAAAEELSEDVMAEKEGSQVAEPETPSQPAADTFSDSSFLNKSSEPRWNPDGHAVPAQRPSCVVLHRLSSTQKITQEKRKRKKATARSSKVAVPTVTVTAPSDQSDDSSTGTGKPSEVSTPTQLSSLPRMIESTDNLPPGWRRVCTMRLGGKYQGRYDTVMFSTDNTKMRSFPDVKLYLEKNDLLHFLDNEEYNFKFSQPFATKTQKARMQKTALGKTSKAKSPTSGSLKAAKNKTPSPKSTAKSKSSLEPIASSTPSAAANSLPLSLTLMRKDSPHGKSAWKVKALPKAKQASKKPTSGSKKEAPQLKLDSFFAKKPSKAAKASEMKSRFKTVLCNTPPAVKSEEAVVKAAESATLEADENVDLTMEKFEEERESDTKEVEVVLDEDASKADEVSDVYLADEQEAPFRSGDEEGDVTFENMSENTSVWELRSEESDVESESTSVPESGSKTAHVPPEDISHFRAEAEQSSEPVRKSGVKRSLSPSDSDVSARKQPRMWREAVEEDDSSHSVGMCSDMSLPPQEEDENQNMASKVQKMHLSDSSSSKDMKDSASTSSSNSSSLAPAGPMLSPSSIISRLRGTKGRRAGPSEKKTATRSSVHAADPNSAASSAAQSCLTVKANGATSTEPQKHRDMKWKPPRSPFNLIQERLYHDPWKLLMSTIFLQEAEAGTAISLLWKFLNRWNHPSDLKGAELNHVARLLQPMERNEMCAATVLRFSDEFLTKNWKYPIELYGINKYGNDSYRIFCVPEWDQVTPDDPRLQKFCQWLQCELKEGGLE